MKIYILILLFPIFLFSKDWHDYITSTETSFSTSLGGGNGLELKSNYDYYEGKYFNALFGLGFMYYQFVDDGSLNSNIQQIEYDFSTTHINLYAGSSVYLTENISLVGELYTGLYFLHINGLYTNSIYNINATDTINNLFFDYGTRLGFAYNVTDKWTLQITIFKSLRTMYEDLPFLMWLVGSVDAPTRLNFGVKYYFD